MKIGLMMIVIGILLMIIGLYIPTLGEDKVVEVDCYDKFNNVILGVQCQKEYGTYDHLIFIAFIGLVLFAFGIINYHVDEYC